MKSKKIKENKKLNKKLFIIILTIVALIAITINVYAYLIHKDIVQNDMTLGFNKISLLENYEPPLTMAKGISFKKEPYAVNTGNVDCYVRMKSVISDSRAADGITIDYNTEDYTYNSEDGYWYYKKAIKPGERSSSLFTTVSVAEDANDKVLDGFDIYVYAESVQTVEGKTVQETWSYFK